MKVMINLGKRVIVNFILLAGGIIMALLIVEASLRLAGITFPSSFYLLDEYTGFSHRPNAEGWFRKEGEAYIRINSHGLRDREHTKEKPPNTLRIAILGDSYAQALQVPLEKAFWSVLERELANCPSVGEQTVEVINFGVSGYGTGAELLTLRHRAWDYAPDIILLAFVTGNDIRNNSRSLQKNPRKPYFVYEAGQLILDNSFRDWQRPRRFYYWLVSHSHLFQVFHQTRGLLTSMKLASQGQAKESTINEIGLDDAIYLEPKDQLWQEAWQITEDLLIILRDEIAEQGANFFVVTLSNPVQVYPDPTVRQQFIEELGAEELFYPDLRLKALGEREGIQVFNLAMPLRKQAEQHRLFLHGFDEKLGFGHWNETGHQLAGELVAQELCEKSIGKLFAFTWREFINLWV